MTIEVVEPGVLSTVQDPGGRDAWRHLGVPQGGAADPWSARLANRLVGNPDDAALIEMTLVGPTLRFHRPATVALTGRLAGSIDGVPLPADAGRAVRPGALLAVGDGDGARGWLAVGGGIDVPSVLGSRSTDLRSGFGGLDGRALRAGDRLRLGASDGRIARWVGRMRFQDTVRIVDGPHATGSAGALAAGPFRAGAEADRTGVRLDGAPVPGGEAPSMGVPPGAIQVPPDGRPIVMLADRPVTGGYLVPAVVIGADIGRVAQLRPGDDVRFARVTLEEAREAWRRAEAELAALEPLGAAGDDELGWTGSHR
ncbi:MAG TPA: biotin-dependent carboxyltransferase family protein [Candidatus Limnocylindrales bacterium]|nr:biotin-dependent carboxyltransferase family protein [Candidatus Limnocylindrales bacterium]